MLAALQMEPDTGSLLLLDANSDDRLELLDRLARPQVNRPNHAAQRTADLVPPPVRLRYTQLRLRNGRGSPFRLLLVTVLPPGHLGPAEFLERARPLDGTVVQLLLRPEPLVRLVLGLPGGIRLRLGRLEFGLGERH